MKLYIIFNFIFLLILHLEGVRGEGNYKAETEDFVEANFTEDGRSSRSFPFLVVVKVPSTICTVNGQQGSCKSRKQCNSDGGTILSGSCGNGYGVCCFQTISCSTNNNGQPTRVTSSGTHIVQPAGYAAPLQCQFVIPRKSGVCQVRLDFISFMMAGPDFNGNCNSDSMTISGADNIRNFITCGANAGQQLYLQYGSSDSISINLNLNNPNGAYDILVSYIDCLNKPNSSTKKRKSRSFSGNSNKGGGNNKGSSSSSSTPSNDVELELAPFGCAQYYTKPSDTVTSFNYAAIQPTANGQQYQINNEQYTVCVKTPPGSNRITWTTCSSDDVFFVSGGATDLPPVGNEQCQTDYVDIPGSELGRYCGSSFPASVTSIAKPYIMYVNFDEQEIFGTNFPINPQTGCPAGSQCWVQGVPAPPAIPPAVAPCGVNAVNPDAQCVADAYIVAMSDFSNVGFCLRYTVS